MVCSQTASSSQEPLVIVGNGMVSWRFCRALVEQGVHRRRPIVVFGEEWSPAYDRVHLTRLFGLEKADELLLASAEWYARHGITLHGGRLIKALWPETKEVVDDREEVHRYSDCILATGSRPFVPPIEGLPAKGAFVYRTLEDVAAIKAACAGARRGLVIGGGLLGLEAAQVLVKRGLETQIVQSSNTLMSRQLNEDGGGTLLKEVARQGMSVRLKTQTRRIERNGTGLRVFFDHGEPSNVDLVIIATGIRPRDELALEAGIPTGVHGGVLIDDHLQAAPHVFAIGECAAYHGKLYGLVGPGYRMADTLAARLAGQNDVFAGADESSRLKLLGIEVATFGDFLQQGETVIHRGENTYRALVFEKERLVGATVVGPWAQTPWIEQAVRARRPLNDRQRDAFVRTGDLPAAAGNASVLVWPDAAVVCNCTATTCGRLRAAVAGGLNTVEALTRETGAGGVCGSCRPQLAEFAGVDAATAARPVRGTRLLAGAAVMGLLAVVVHLLAPPFPAAETVQSGYYRFTQLWQDSLTKQVTGYTLAGLSALALLLSARKRCRFLRFGNYGFWRAAHSWLGVTTLAVLVFHTGLRFGSNLNLWLLICFLGLNFAGAVAALAVAAERRVAGGAGLKLRRAAMHGHILFFLPYPVLLGFHIAKVYLY